MCHSFLPNFELFSEIFTLLILFFKKLVIQEKYSPIYIVNVPPITPTHKFRIGQFARQQNPIVQIARQELPTLQFERQQVPIVQFARQGFFIVKFARQQFARKILASYRAACERTVSFRAICKIGTSCRAICRLLVYFCAVSNKFVIMIFKRLLSNCKLAFSR